MPRHKISPIRKRKYFIYDREKNTSICQCPVEIDPNEVDPKEVEQHKNKNKKQKKNTKTEEEDEGPRVKTTKSIGEKCLKELLVSYLLLHKI